MRKLTALLLALVMVFSMTGNAFAASFVPTVSSNEVQAGEDVTVTLSLDEALENMISLECYVYFNPNHFELKEGAIGAENTHLGRTLRHSEVFVDSDEKHHYSVNFIDPYSDSYTINAGAFYTLTFTAKQDLTAEQATKFELVTQDGRNLFEGKSETVSVPLTAEVLDVTIKTAAPAEYDITIGSMENGSVTASKEKAAADEEITLTVTPAEGYELENLTVKAGETDVSVTDNKFTMPASAVSVNATFIAKKIPVTSVGLSETAIEMYLNSGIKQLYATVSPDNATDKTVTWTSSDENVATVNAAGIVYSVGVGEAVITATADGVSATCTVTVYDPATQFPYTLSVNGEDLEVTANGTTSSCMFGEQSLFEVTVPADATEMLITFDGESMTVMDDSAGSPNIIAQNVTEYTLDLTQGYAEIHLADNDNNVHRHVRINVAEPEKIPVTGVTLSVSEYTLDAIGGEFVLVATITPSNATNQEVVWETSDANVATVENGYIKAVGGGNCEITATVDDVTATCVVTVIDPRETFPFSVSVNGEDLEATYVGTEECNISGERALYEVTVPADATSMMIYYDGEAMIIQNEADKAKLAQNVAEYEVDLTAGYEKLCIREDNRIRYHLAINVAEPETPAVSITLDKTELELSSFAGEHYFTLTVTGADKADVVWASTNENVAMIYAMPKYDMYMVQGMGPGECDITATVGGVTATCHVTVVDPVLDSFPFTITVDGTDVEAVADGTEMCDYGPRLYKYVVTVPADAKIMHLSYDNESAYIIPDHSDEYLLEGGVDCDVDLTKGYKVLDLWDADDPNLMIHLHIVYAEPVAPSYTVNMPEDKETVGGETVNIPVTVGHTDSSVTVYNAFDFTFTYDPAVLELTSTDEEITDVKNEEGNPTGVIHVERYGDDLSVGGTALTLKFKALTAAETEIKLTAAKVSVSETALSQEAADASVLDDTTAIKITGYTVNLPEDFEGGSVAYPDEDYTFEAKDKNYDYTVKATINGEEIVVTDNGDGTFTIPDVQITGNINITSTKVGKTFNVSLGEDMTSEAANAQYMTPYTATLTKEPGYGYNITVTIGGNEYKGFTFDDTTGILTIPGKDITGEIVIDSGKEAGEFTVTFEGNGAGDAQGEAVANGGEAYSFTLTKAEGYEYTVTATMGGKEVELDVVGDTYSIAKVTGDIVITIEKTSDLKVEVNEYVTLNGKTVFLVTATQTLAEGKALSYDGTVMFYSNRYNEWAYLVIVEEGTLTVEDAKAKITDGDASFTTLEPTFDVNEAGKVDINDAQLVFDMYNNEYQDFSVATMQKFLNADVNGDKAINVNDAAAIVAEIVAAK